jgi:hypothetical protein
MAVALRKDITLKQCAKLSERKGFGNETDRGSIASAHKMWTPSQSR